MTVRENSGISVRLTAPRAHNSVGLVRRISDLRWLVRFVPRGCLSTAASASDTDSWQIRILPATKLRLAQAPAPQPGAAQPAPAPARRAGGQADAEDL